MVAEGVIQEQMDIAQQHEPVKEREQHTRERPETFVISGDGRSSGGVSASNRKVGKARSPTTSSPISGTASTTASTHKTFVKSEANPSTTPVKTSSGSSSSKEGKRSKPEAPKFLLLLYEILQTESARVIRWSDDGLSLQILDPAVVTDKILPKYFNHTNFHSFQRQLNYFGFRKWTKSKTDICTFSHPYFRQNQPELLQLIKRKKAPRRAPVADKVEGYCNQLENGANTTGSKKLLALSPTGKRKLPSPDEHTAGQMLPQLNTSNVPIQPAINGVPIGSMHHAHAHHLASLSQDGQYHHHTLPGSALLNNVISPVAATESRKKAKKMDKKTYPETSVGPLPSPLDPATTISERGPPGAASSYSNAALPTLDIVRNRIIRRQQVSGASADVSYAYPGFSSPHGTSNGYGSSAATGAATMDHRELINTTLPMASSLGTGEQSPAFSNSFSDPVNILLRIKKSRTSSSDGQNNTSEMVSPESYGADQTDNLASLHNYLLGNSLYTHRLESQWKFVKEENEALKNLVDTLHREVESLQNERKMMQHENSVLMEDKNKLFEINRELLAKLFPQ